MRKGSAKAEPFGILSFADMRLAAEDHVVHVAMTDVVFFLHCTIPFSFSLTRLLYARANEKLYEKGQQRIKKRLADFYAQEGHCICKIKKRRRLSRPQTRNNFNHKSPRHARGDLFFSLRACRSRPPGGKARSEVHPHLKKRHGKRRGSVRKHLCERIGVV